MPYTRQCNVSVLDKRPLFYYALTLCIFSEFTHTFTYTKMHRLLQMKVISTAELRIKKKTITDSLLVIIRTDCNNIWTSKKLETGPNEKGHVCKQYDNILQMDLPVHVGFISVEVYYSKGKNYDKSSKFIGGARIPVSDFLGGSMSENYVHYLSYRLRDADGLRNGVLNLSIKVTSSGCVSKPVTLSAMMPEMGVPVHHGKMNPGIVTGVPVNWYAESCS